jgi:two-component system sensor histidine kinase QseC
LNKPWSIRRRLVFLAGGGGVALAIASGLSTDLILEARMRRDFDDELLEKARILSTLTEQEGSTVAFEPVGDTMPEFQRLSRAQFYEVRRADGTPLARSQSLGANRLALFDTTPAAPGASGAHPAAPPVEPRFVDLHLPDGRYGRAVRIGFEPRYVVRDPSGEERAVPEGALATAPRARAEIVVAAGLEDLRSDINEMRAVLAAMALLLVLGLIAVVRWAIVTGLRPLSQIADRVAALDPESLAERVSSPDLPAEIKPLTARLDDLLTRLESTFERERLFSSNVAHELRTPVAELRSLAEVAARWPGDREAIRSFFADVESVAGQMEGLISNLLALARSEAGVDSVQPEEAVLEDLTRAVWARMGRRTEERRLSLDLEATPHAVVVTDVAKLRLILANLLGNAVEYAPAGSAVACHVAIEEPSFRLSVSNPAPDLERDDLGRLFDRFWRKDEARGGGRHAGLGLTLVRTLCATLGYRVEPRLAGGVLAIQISGPRVVSA